MFRKRLFTFIVTAFLLGNALIAHAQRIFLFSEGDYLDGDVGQTVSRETDHVKFFFGQLPRNRVVIYNRSNTWSGSVFSAKNSFRESGDVKNAILAAIRSCPARPSDKIVFYWAGFGAFDKDGGHYIMMPEINGKQVKMYRSEILNALKAKKASLIVLVTDSCSSNEDFPYLAAEPSMPPRGGIFPIYNSLFFNCSGVVDVNSASPGEKSVYNEIGSLFTNCFFGAMDIDCDNGAATWKETLERVDELLQNGKKNQHMYKWSVPKQVKLVEPVQNNWSAPRFHPEPGDRIVNVNGIDIRNEAHYRQVIRDADTRVVLTLIDHRSGNAYKMMTDLNPKGSASRLGIYIEDDGRGGVLVTGVIRRSPGNRCRYQINGGDDDSDESEQSQWSKPAYHPEVGDRIVYVNGIEIQDEAHFSRVIRSADTRVVLTLVDHRKGNSYKMMTDLNPKGSASRLGIYIEDDYRGGVVVTGVIPGSPGTRCRYLMDGKVQSVRSSVEVY